MLLILAFSLVIASVFLIIYRKNKDSILWLGLCTSLMLELCGVMLFIAKKGGISQEVLTFLYFSRNIYRKMQYFLITLGQLGYLIAIGRSLFPFFLLRIAMNYSMLPGLTCRANMSPGSILRIPRPPFSAFPGLEDGMDIWFRICRSLRRRMLLPQGFRSGLLPNLQGCSVPDSLRKGRRLEC